MNQRHAITANAADRGYDILAGTEITGTRIGGIYVDNGGLVLRAGEAEYLPDSASEAVSILASIGFALTAESITDIEGLGGG